MSSNSIITKLQKSKPLQNVGFLTLGNVASQIVSLVGALYIPRLLGPENYGDLNIVISYVAFFMLFTFEGLDRVFLRESAGNLAEMEKYFQKFFGLRVLFSFIAPFVSAFALLFVNYNQVIEYYILLFSIDLIFNGGSQVFLTIFQAHQDLKYVALVSAIKNISVVLLSILVLHFGYGILAIIVVRLVVDILYCLILITLVSRKYFRPTLPRAIGWSRDILKQGWNFSLIQFLNLLSGRVDILMLSFLGTNEQVGLYAVAYNIAQKGLIIRQPISHSLFPYYAKLFKEQQISNRLLVKHTVYILVPSICIVLVVFVLSDFFIVKIIGPEFISSSVILKVLILYLTLNYAAIPYGLFLQVAHFERFVVSINLLRAFLNITGNIVLFRLVGLIGVAYSTLISVLFTLIMFIYVSRKRILK